jgi:hypothetical protein
VGRGLEMDGDGCIAGVILAFGEMEGVIDERVCRRTNRYTYIDTHTHIHI